LPSFTSLRDMNYGAALALKPLFTSLRDMNYGAALARWARPVPSTTRPRFL